MELIFGYTWNQINEAQQGNSSVLHPTIKNKTPDIVLTDKDLDLFNEVGIPGLEKLGYFGLIDRLKRAGVID
jgi:hypothetical protein